MQEVTDRTEQQQRSIDELTDTIAGRNEKCEALKRETEGLKRDLDGRELPFLYTAVPLASSDMYGPSWRRSEEHTSELQSLMRISYAVFCLKKKNNKSRITSNTPQTTKPILVPTYNSY